MLLNCVLINSLEDPSKDTGNPTEMAIIKYFFQNNFDAVEYRKHFKITQTAAFNSDRKRMSTLCKIGNEDYVFIKGASELILETCSKY